MRKKSRILKQEEKIRKSIFLRPDQFKELELIRESEDTYFLDVLEEIIDLGLSVYYGDSRETRGIGNIKYKPEVIEGDNFLYD